jgi:hypothetical protein
MEGLFLNDWIKNEKKIKLLPQALSRLRGILEEETLK